MSLLAGQRGLLSCLWTYFYNSSFWGADWNLFRSNKSAAIIGDNFAFSKNLLHFSCEIHLVGSAVRYRVSVTHIGIFSGNLLPKFGLKTPLFLARYSRERKLLKTHLFCRVTIFFHTTHSVRFQMEWRAVTHCREIRRLCVVNSELYSQLFFMGTREPFFWRFTPALFNFTFLLRVATL